MIAADDPKRAVILQDPAALGQPFASELVVGRKALELVPVIIDRIDLGIVRAQQVAAKLEVVGGIGENEVDRFLGQLPQFLDAVPVNDGVGTRRGANRSSNPNGALISSRPSDASRTATAVAVSGQNRMAPITEA